MKKEFVIEKRYEKPVKFVLERDDIPYTYTQRRQKHFISADLSDEEFDIVLEDAQCEIERDESLSKIPVYSLRTFENEEKLERLMELNQCNCHVIMKKDEAAFERYYCD